MDAGVPCLPGLSISANDAAEPCSDDNFCDVEPEIRRNVCPACFEGDGGAFFAGDVFRFNFAVILDVDGVDDFVKLELPPRFNRNFILILVADRESEL